ncbi:MAG: hypothetical protein IRY91_05045 [Gemmatimonadaceae bacterium]|nr:hypothetical protein [Gemmatimonadaceae bacterium]
MHAPALIALLASLALYLLVLALIAGIGDQDAALHALYTRFPAEPSRLLSVWSRPLFAIPYLLPAQLGYPAMRVFTVLVCAAAAWLTYLIARKIAPRGAWIAIPLVLLQPSLLAVGTDTMTEPIFALALAAGLLALARDRLLIAAAIWSFLPLARPEGLPILGLLGLLWLPRAVRERRFRAAVALLPLGLVVWEVVCVIVTRDPLYLVHTFPWTVGSSPAHGTVLHYVHRWPAIVGWGVLVLSLVGVWPSWRQPLLRLCIIMVAAIVLVHTYLFAFGKMGSWGFDRYFATLAPANALVAVAGVGWLDLRVIGPRLTNRLVALLLALEAWQAFTMVVFQPMNYLAGATRDALRVAERQLDLRGRTFVSTDHFGYVFFDDDSGSRLLPVATHDVTAPAVARFPRGTVVLWDDMIGDWWFHLSLDDFTSRGYRVLWSREKLLGSRFAEELERIPLLRNGRLYPWLGMSPTRPVHQALLVRE